MKRPEVIRKKKSLTILLGPERRREREEEKEGRKKKKRRGGKSGPRNRCRQGWLTQAVTGCHSLLKRKQE